MTESPKEYSQHWIDQLTTDLINNWPKVSNFNCNCGISISGKQHVGRLRGEIVLTNAVTTELQARSYNATHYLILYTSDPWKGKESQLNAFKDPEKAKEYINWRLVDVPDPSGSEKSWIDFFWEDFGTPMPKFGKNIHIIRTHELYQRDDMKKIVISLIKKKNQVRKILNKYRQENPFPEDWIPINPLCTHCNRIGTTKALDVDLKTYTVKYYCEECQTEGWSDISLGKLTWRLEWLAIWYTLNVHFEPYGKDHATPGGSRDSCIEVLETVLKRRGPFGFWNEWVGYSEDKKDFGDMTSSGFIGFTPTTWLSYAEPEVLKYIYLKTPAKRRIVLGLDRIPSYVAEYDRAQRIYFNLEPFDDNAELVAIKRSYEIVFYNQVPPYRGFQLDYSHALILTQLVPSDNSGLDMAIDKLQGTGMLMEDPSKEIIEHIRGRLDQTRSWVNSPYAPTYLRINIPKEIPKEIIKSLDSEIRRVVLQMADQLEKIPWNEEEIKNCMITLREEAALNKKKMNLFFQALYQIFLGTPQGPRFAPFIVALDREWVVNRLQQVKN